MIIMPSYIKIQSIANIISLLIVLQNKHSPHKKAHVESFFRALDRNKTDNLMIDASGETRLLDSPEDSKSSYMHNNMLVCFLENQSCVNAMTRKEKDTPGDFETLKNFFIIDAMSTRSMLLIVVDKQTGESHDYLERLQLLQKGHLPTLSKKDFIPNKALMAVMVLAAEKNATFKTYLFGEINRAKRELTIQRRKRVDDRWRMGADAVLLLGGLLILGSMAVMLVAGVFYFTSNRLLDKPSVVFGNAPFFFGTMGPAFGIALGGLTWYLNHEIEFYKKTSTCLAPSDIDDVFQRLTDLEERLNPALQAVIADDPEQNLKSQKSEITCGCCESWNPWHWLAGGREQKGDLTKKLITEP
jgi:hypothetical protein